jgi:hypothetical protein
MQGTMDVLTRNHRYYGQLARVAGRLNPRTHPEAVLAAVELAGAFASLNHPGLFADGTLENLALSLGMGPPASGRDALSSQVPAAPARTRRRHVLHVTTNVLGIGGGPRCIKNWIEGDRDSHHSLAVVRQEHFPVPTWMEGPVRASGGNFVVFPPEAPTVAKGLALRRLAQSGPDLVLMHLLPDDILPVVAFATADCPPVGFVNHSDQLFWFGSCVSDAIVNLRGASGQLYQGRRPAVPNVLVPIPLESPREGQGREASRQRLGVPDSQLMLLSVGRPSKYVPSETHNFYRAAVRLLSLHPQAHVYVLGVRDGDHRAYSGYATHERLHLLGPVEDPTPYQAAADVYLEGVPFGSQTACLEAAGAGLPPVLAYAPTSDLLVASDAALDGTVANPTSEDEYVAAAGSYVSSPAERSRVGTELRQKVAAWHVGEAWRQRLEGAYAVLQPMRHAPRPIAPGTFRPEPVDLAVSGWHQVKYANDPDDRAYRSRLGRQFMDTAYWARQRGDCSGALALIGEAGRLTGWTADKFTAAVKLVPHWLLQAGLAGGARG